MNKQYIILILVALMSNMVHAQTADEIISNYIKNTGGKAEWLKVTTLKIEGNMLRSGSINGFSYTSYSTSSNKTYMEAKLGRYVYVTGFDGNSDWYVVKEEGPAKKGSQKRSEETESKQFESIFINYKDKGHKVKLLGKEEIDGKECFKIKMVKKNGEKEMYYFETENYLKVLMEQKITDKGSNKGKVLKCYFSDYTKIGDGLRMPFVTEYKIDGKMTSKTTIQNVEVNPVIDDSIFFLPK